MNGTGIWIGQEILEHKLPLLQTMILAMITEMQKPNFFASNKYIAEILNVNIRSVIRAIKDLQVKGLITISGHTSARIITSDKMAVVKNSYRQNVRSTTDKLSLTTDKLSLTTDKLSPNNKDNKDNKEYIREIKHKHGEYKHVLLTDKQYQDLQIKTKDVKEWIRKLDEYLQNTGKSYKDHHLTMLTWYRKDNKNKEGIKRKPVILPICSKCGKEYVGHECQCKWESYETDRSETL